jgi:CheY-like chemotaxis protein
MDKPILLVEDDLVDAMTVKRALRDIEFTGELHHVENGEEALAFLRDPEKPRPAIILLDLNMPRMNGVEFLQVAKQDAKLRQIPVIVLTTSQEEHDRFASFDQSAAGYMIKPVDYAQFVKIMRVVNNYWQESQLPD